VRYLDDAFRASRYREPALLRGIYFTSGTQEGSPIDRVMASFAAMFGIDRQALAPSVGSGRSYFVTRLLREVLFEESGLAGADPRLERRRRWIQRAVLALAALAFVGLSAALVTSYFRNQAYVQDVTKRIETIRQTAGNLPPSAGVLTLMPLLDEARDLPGGWRDRDRGTPLLSGFGLYQGDKLGSEAQELYQRLLRQTLLPRVVARLEDQLRRGNANNPEYLYEVLRAYLMLGDKRHFKAETVAAVVEYDWKRTLGEISDDQRAALSNHLVALLDHVQDDGGPQPVRELVASARLALQQTPLAKRVYESLKREALLAKIADFSVAANAGKDAALVFARRSAQPLTQGVIGFFTPDGYRALLKGLDPALVEVAQDGWLLGREEAVTTPADAETLKAQILDNYYTEYIKEWDRLLADVGAVAPASLEQEARIAGIMAQPDSPLKRFIVAASQATSLATVSTATLVDTLKDRADSALKKLEQKLASDAPPPAPGAGAAANQNPVDRHFDELHRLVAPAGGGAMPLDQIMATLNEVAVYLDGANSAKREGRPAPSGEVLDKLRRDAAGKPEPVGPILTGVAESGAALTAGSERGRLNALWIANVATFCREAIAGRYPVQRGSSRDITQDDFGRLFAPGGLIDDFFQKNLLQYADISPARWTWRAAGNDSLGFSSAALAEFQQAAKIRDAFFSGGKTASIRFDLKPLQLDSNVAHLTLDIDGERFEYSHGPTSPHAFQWPSGKVSGLSRIELEGTDGSRIARSAEGPWDLFKLLEIGRLEPTAQPDRFRVTFNLDGRSGSFELQASSVRNPFGLAALQEFHCPDHL
jgi:type VI secretion system protein ImpL